MSTIKPTISFLNARLCFALTVASRSVVGIYKPVLERLGLTHPQYLVMLALWERSPRTLKDLSDALLHEPATLSPLLRRLEEADLVTRERVQGNERASPSPSRRRARPSVNRQLPFPGRSASACS